MSAAAQRRGIAANDELERMTILKDRCDDLMRVVHGARDETIDNLDDQARKVASAITATNIIGNSLDKLEAAFKSKGGRQITQQTQENNRG
jgi:hypothetical protein